MRAIGIMPDIEQDKFNELLFQYFKFALFALQYFLTHLLSRDQASCYYGHEPLLQAPPAIWLARSQVTIYTV